MRSFPIFFAERTSIVLLQSSTSKENPASQALTGRFCRFSAMLKKILKAFGILIGLLVLLAATVWFQQVDPVQYDLVENPYLFPDTLAGRYFDRDSLEAVVGPNKGLPEGFEIQALLAYSAYPELKGVKIDMLLTQEGAPMESNFNIWSLFGSGRNRHYRILLNNASNTPYDEILLKALPFDAQVGILAHELGHVAYYHRHNTFQIGKWGLSYLLNDEFRAAHEQSTDLTVMYHGLGGQIWQYAYYVRYGDCCKATYAEFGNDFMDKYYLSDKAIKEAMEEHELYR